MPGISVVEIWFRKWVHVSKTSSVRMCATVKRTSWTWTARVNSNDFHGSHCQTPWLKFRGFLRAPAGEYDIVVVVFLRQIKIFRPH